ncbi:pyridoxamine 5-phosphate oxidase [Actinobacteria bacterium YIM 96077]|uniref:Pyridoxamine 5-phosphate oxidase n=1 Tax=Phytoactinopolyspora halophila TaxID=1981511 RepID=A0A329QR95_9ACTN|nr:pyridoxamine 5'-phosphate oxidase family protein [Phytoactinopolyspora halophila]AYY14334.1 pyridoxamine 5-phosphate oxidase [Actinobacteria bacterium YIM 96077]RAW14877.1 pyridoxamine 5-phosphate oxidase [Phytoactinopolyspora halophila]
MTQPHVGIDDDRPGSTGEHVLQEQCGSRDRADRFYSEQMSDHLNDQMREFVGRMEMVFVGTADGHGECDVSFRAGPAGFVRVLDPRRIAWPEFRGNGVLASAGNITENPHVGLLFMDFVHDLVGLHINGTASLMAADDFRAWYPDQKMETEAPGRRPERWILVDIEEAYIHCSKHIPRMMPVPRNRAWGTDDRKKKGGDYFGVAEERGLSRRQRTTVPDTSASVD